MRAHERVTLTSHDRRISPPPRARADDADDDRRREVARAWSTRVCDARTTTARRLCRPSHAARLASRRDDRVRARDASEILDADGRLGRGGGSREIGRFQSFTHSFIGRSFRSTTIDALNGRTGRA